jgi:hypothetical protein
MPLEDPLQNMSFFLVIKQGDGVFSLLCHYF